MRRYAWARRCPRSTLRRRWVSRGPICDIEKGRRNVSLGRAATWAKLLGYSETQFIRLALEQMVAAAGLKVKITVEAA